jgi:aspartate/tyrosine/aromatic aminotransferase
MESQSIFSNLPDIAKNKLFDIARLYNLSENPNKMDLSIGMLYDQEGNLIQFKSVETAQKMIHGDEMNKEYPIITGIPEYNSAIQNLFFSADSDVVKEKRILTCHSITGGASLRIGAEVIKKFLIKKIHLSNMTFGPYHNIFSNLEIAYYPYFNEDNRSLDLQAFLKYLNTIQNGSIINLQLSGHNPTALDWSKSDWDEIAEIMKERNHLAFFDVAYLGYGSGSIEEDLYAIHKFAQKKVEMMISYSSAKNFSNFSDDVGAFLVVFNNPEPVMKLKSHLVVINRSIFSFVSLYGSRVVERILNNESLRTLWKIDMKNVIDLIFSLRAKVIDEMKKQNLKINLDFLKAQKGLYIFLNLNADQVEKLREKYSIFLCERGRLNITSIKEKNITYLVASLKDIMDS